MTREEMSKLHRGDVVEASDGAIVKIHHFDASGRVFYEAFVRTKGNPKVKMKIQHPPYKFFYGYVRECKLATEDQKALLEKCVSDSATTWIKEHERKD